MSDEELADAAIVTVQREPDEPSGLGMRRIIAGLFRQARENAVAAERERCAELVDTTLPTAEELAAGRATWTRALCAAVRRIRATTRPESLPASTGS